MSYIGIAAFSTHSTARALMAQQQADNTRSCATVAKAIIKDLRREFLIGFIQPDQRTFAGWIKSVHQRASLYDLAQTQPRPVLSQQTTKQARSYLQSTAHRDALISELNRRLGENSDTMWGVAFVVDDRPAGRSWLDQIKLKVTP